MSNQTLSTSKVTIGGYELCITSRSSGDSPQVLQDLTFRTIGAFLKIAKMIEDGTYDTITAEAFEGSVEERYTAFRRETDPEFNLCEAWGDARVTVWDTNRGSKVADLHLNSDDHLRVAIETWVAHKAAIQMALEKFPPAIQHEKAQPAPADEKPATPKGNGSNGQTTTRFLTRKQMLEQLHEGDTAPMKIAKVMLRSQDDTRYYELYPMLGNGSIGRYAELRVYTDNEVAEKNGVLKVLNDIGLKTGKGMESTWIVQCIVAKNKKGELDTYPQSIQESA